MKVSTDHRLEELREVSYTRLLSIEEIQEAVGIMREARLAAGGRAKPLVKGKKGSAKKQAQEEAAKLTLLEQFKLL